MARLATYVHVTDDDGQSHVFGPLDEVPGWAAKRITNRKAWDEAPAETDGEQSNGEPPRSGKGSSKDAWAAFAAGHGVKLENDATRDDYIAVLAERGIVAAE